MRQHELLKTLGLVLSALFTSSAMGLQPRVKDDAGFFRPETVREADQLITRIKTNSGKDFVVETFAEIPSSLRDEFQSRPRERFYREWVDGRSKGIGVNGVYVLILKNPEHLQIGWRGSPPAITDVQGRELNETLVKGFRQRQYDSALLETVRLFELQTIGQTAGTSDSDPLGGSGSSRKPDTPWPQAPGGPAIPVANEVIKRCGPGNWVCLAVAALAVFTLLRALARRRASLSGRRYDEPVNPPGGGYGGGGGFGGGGFGGGPAGGGFGRGILGGLLGGLLGGWAMNRQARGEQNTSPLPGSSPDAGNDFGTAGGDFGGGGHPGGADFGNDGGNRGGNDFGSAGSDFGTAGGDFGAEADSGGSSDFGGGSDSGGGDSSDFGSAGGDFS